MTVRTLKLCKSERGGTLHLLASFWSNGLRLVFLAIRLMLPLIRAMADMNYLPAFQMKCDTARPSCKNCIEHGETCNYQRETKPRQVPLSSSLTSIPPNLDVLQTDTCRYPGPSRTSRGITTSTRSSAAGISSSRTQEPRTVRQRTCCGRSSSDRSTTHSCPIGGITAGSGWATAGA